MKSGLNFLDHQYKKPFKDSGSEVYVEGWLYDLSSDSLGQHNLIEDMRYSNIKLRLKESMIKHAHSANEVFKIIE